MRASTSDARHHTSEMRASPWKSGASAPRKAREISRAKQFAEKLTDCRAE
jgi:hypothetical protein